METQLGLVKELLSIKTPPVADKPPPKPTKWCLVYWIDDQMVSIEKITAVVGEENRKQGVVSDIKFRDGKRYAGKILHISENKKALLDEQTTVLQAMEHVETLSPDEKEETTSAKRLRKASAKMIDYLKTSETISLKAKTKVTEQVNASINEKVKLQKEFFKDILEYQPLPQAENSVKRIQQLEEDLQQKQKRIKEMEELIESKDKEIAHLNHKPATPSSFQLSDGIQNTAPEENTAAVEETKLVGLYPGGRPLIAETKKRMVLSKGTSKETLLYALLSAVFGESRLARGNACGARQAVNKHGDEVHSALDPSILHEIKECVLQRFKLGSGLPCFSTKEFNSKVNQKCATARRALKRHTEQNNV